MVNITIKEAEKVNGDLSAFISFPYDAELVGIMRTQTSRFWHAAAKEWEVPAKKLITLINKMGNREITLTGNYKDMEEKVPKLL